MNGQHLFRRLLVVGALLMPFGSAAPAAGETSTTTQVSVEIVDTGSLDVRFTGPAITFTTESGESPGVTTVTGDTAYADLQLVINDTRTSPTRPLTTLLLSMGDFTHREDSTIVISSANLAVLDVIDEPEGVAVGLPLPASLSQQVPLLDISAPPVGEHIVTVRISLTVPPGTVPGVFTGSAYLSEVPAGS